MPGLGHRGHGVHPHDGDALEAISLVVTSDDMSMKAAGNGKTAKLRKDKKDDERADAQVPNTT